MDVVENCIKQINEDIAFRRLPNGVCALTFPILDFKNDLIEVWIVNFGNGRYRIDDNGDTINELASNGVDINDWVIKSRIDDIAKACGIKVSYDLCYVDTDEQTMAYKIQKFVSGLIQISSIYYFRDLLSEVK